MAKETGKMFLFLGSELTILFIVICFIIALIQQYVSNEKIQKILSGRKESGYVMAAIFGALTPFCSCSTIPMLRGLLKANVGFGQMMTFLFVSPLLNPIIVGLFFATFGAKATGIYISIALFVSIIASFILKTLKFERFIMEEKETQSSCCSCGCSSIQTTVQTTCCCSAPTKVDIFKDNVKIAYNSAIKQFKDVLPYLAIGVSIGAFIYGFMPSDVVAKYAGGNNIFAVPIAAVIGIPLYIRMEAVIPLAGVLASKGMGLGAIMSLIIGSSGASITEVILLKSMFKWPLIIAFLTVIFTMAVLTGYLFQYFIHI
ncbi:MAG: permease [Fusobacterium sp.]|nr:permease [Fusobacterium sp.]